MRYVPLQHLTGVFGRYRCDWVKGTCGVARHSWTVLLKIIPDMSAQKACQTISLVSLGPISWHTSPIQTCRAWFIIGRLFWSYLPNKKTFRKINSCREMFIKKSISNI